MSRTGGRCPASQAPTRPLHVNGSCLGPGAEPRHGTGGRIALSVSGSGTCRKPRISPSETWVVGMSTQAAPLANPAADPAAAFAIEPLAVTIVGFPLEASVRSILLKNSLSARTPRICGDVARCSREVPRGYRSKAPASPGSSRFASIEIREQCCGRAGLSRARDEQTPVAHGIPALRIAGRGPPGRVGTFAAVADEDARRTERSHRSTGWPAMFLDPPRPRDPCVEVLPATTLAKLRARSRALACCRPAPRSCPWSRATDRQSAGLSATSSMIDAATRVARATTQRRLRPTWVPSGAWGMDGARPTSIGGRTETGIGTGALTGTRGDKDPCAGAGLVARPEPRSGALPERVPPRRLGSSTIRE
jgi:hypothetical protein